LTFFVCLGLNLRTATTKKKNTKTSPHDRPQFWLAVLSLVSSAQPSAQRSIRQVLGANPSAADKNKDLQVQSWLMELNPDLLA
jgi:hypothetical protein